VLGDQSAAVVQLPLPFNAQLSVTSARARRTLDAMATEAAPAKSIKIRRELRFLLDGAIFPPRNQTAKSIG
jgi:hypothetical protein